MSAGDGLDSFRDEGPQAVGPAPEEVDEPRLVYGSVDEFVREKLVRTYRRKVGDQGQYRWAGDWWMYPEAVSRLEALWRAWENLRLDPATGMSIWWRDHADPHMGVLLSTEGPFAASTHQNKRGDPLPYVHPPEGLFPDVRESGYGTPNA